MFVVSSTCDHSSVNLCHKSQNASGPYPTMQHFVTEMCTCVHISVTKWCIVGYLSDALWDLWGGSIVRYNLPMRAGYGMWVVNAVRPQVYGIICPWGWAKEVSVLSLKSHHGCTVSVTMLYAMTCYSQNHYMMWMRYEFLYTLTVYVWLCYDNKTKKYIGIFVLLYVVK